MMKKPVCEWITVSSLAISIVALTAPLALPTAAAAPSPTFEGCVAKNLTDIEKKRELLLALAKKNSEADGFFTLSPLDPREADALNLDNLDYLHAQGAQGRLVQVRIKNGEEDETFNAVQLTRAPPHNAFGPAFDEVFETLSAHGIPTLIRGESEDSTTGTSSIILRVHSKTPTGVFIFDPHYPTTVATIREFRKLVDQVANRESIYRKISIPQSLVNAAHKWAQENPTTLMEKIRVNALNRAYSHQAAKKAQTEALLYPFSSKGFQNIKASPSLLREISEYLSELKSFQDNDATVFADQVFIDPKNAVNLVVVAKSVAFGSVTLLTLYAIDAGTKQVKQLYYNYVLNPPHSANSNH